MWCYNHIWVSMVVADGLVPIWHQDICNHHDDVSWLIHFRGLPRQCAVLQFNVSCVNSSLTAITNGEISLTTHMVYLLVSTQLSGGAVQLMPWRWWLGSLVECSTGGRLGYWKREMLAKEFIHWLTNFSINSPQPVNWGWYNILIYQYIAIHSYQGKYCETRTILQYVLYSYIILYSLLWLQNHLQQMK